MSKPTYVYLIGRQVPGGGVCHPVKLGITGNPDKRLKQLQTASAYQLAIVAVIMMPERRFALILEKMMHAALSDDLMVGEWFDTKVFHAAGLLAAITRDMFEHMGGEGEQLLDLLDWCGASALMARWCEENEARRHQ